MRVVAVGLNHTTAPVDLREQLAFPKQELGESLQGLVRKASLREVVLLSTCNRVEVYGVQDPAEDPERVAAALADLRGVEPRTLHPHSFVHDDEQAARHIFRVTASLESLVLGEPQILGQVKDAYRVAREVGTVGSVLDRCLTMAFHGAKRVRSETEIAQGRASVASVAVDLAASIFGQLEGCRVLLVGAGEMAQHAAVHLTAAGAASVAVVNRSAARGESLADTVGGRYVGWDGLTAELAQADIVITSTGSPDPVIDRRMVRRAMRARRGAPLFLVDIAVPRDVDPRVGRMDQVYLYNVDDLQGMVDESMESRHVHAEHASRVVDEEVLAFLRWKRGRNVAPVLRSLEEKARGILDGEMRRARGKLGELTPEQMKAVEMLGHGIVRKMLHGPLSSVREAGELGQHDLADALSALFRLDADDEEAAPAELHVVEDEDATGKPPRRAEGE